ncbi:MAG: hypothetical protein HY910_07210 [Desulfarculus sp.]|nr:hypothetical protein [Desulfarculus sp.]
MDDLKQQVSRRLKLAISNKYKGKWTVFARDARVSDGTAKRWLDGLSLPGSEHLTSISSVLGVSTDWLLKGSEPCDSFSEPSLQASPPSAPIQPLAHHEASSEERELELFITEMEAWMRRTVMRRPEALEQISSGVRRLINEVEGVSEPTPVTEEQNKDSPRKVAWGPNGEGG